MGKEEKTKKKKEMISTDEIVRLTSQRRQQMKISINLNICRSGDEQNIFALVNVNCLFTNLLFK